MQAVDKIWLATTNQKRTPELKPVDFMHFVERPKPKPVDLADEAVQAQIDKECFGM